MSILSVMSTLRTHPTVYQRHVHFDNTCNWLSKSCPHLEHHQLIISILFTMRTPTIISVMPTLITPATDYRLHVHFENICNWVSMSCPPWGHLQLIISAILLWEHLQLVISVSPTLWTPVTDYQHHAQLENTCNWLSASCPPWEHLQLVISVISTLSTHTTVNRNHLINKVIPCN